jgi:hypothetical protein
MFILLTIDDRINGPGIRHTDRSEDVVDAHYDSKAYAGGCRDDGILVCSTPFGPWSASAMAISSSESLIGFEIYPSIPAARQRSRSPFIAWAVIAMIGM